MIPRRTGPQDIGPMADESPFNRVANLTSWIGLSGQVSMPDSLPPTNQQPYCNGNPLDLSLECENCSQDYPKVDLCLKMDRQSGRDGNLEFKVIQVFLAYTGYILYSC